MFGTLVHRLFQMFGRRLHHLGQLFDLGRQSVNVVRSFRPSISYLRHELHEHSSSSISSGSFLHLLTSTRAAWTPYLRHQLHGHRFLQKRLIGPAAHRRRENSIGAVRPGEKRSEDHQKPEHTLYFLLCRVLLVCAAPTTATSSTVRPTPSFF